MAIQKNTFEVFTITFSALSLAFTLAATAGDYWLLYTGLSGIEAADFGLWEYCEGRHDKICYPYPSVEGRKNICSNKRRVIMI